MKKATCTLAHTPSFRLKSVVALTTCILSLNAYANTQTYDDVVFFGDSLTDGGYFRPIVGTNVGEFTTNPDHTWADSFAKHLGLSAQAVTIAGGTGNNYAVRGARAGESFTNQQGAHTPSVSEQVDNYLAKHTPSSQGIYSVWVGANDLFNVQGPADLLAAVNSTQDSVQKLHRAGANYILVPNIPDVGLTPLKVSNAAASQAATQGASIYNNLLLSKLQSTGANVIVLDTFSLLQEVAQNPSAYGFVNMTEKACGNVSSLICTPDDWVADNANQTYFFADDIHPTGRAHQMIADYAYSVISAPSQMARTAHLIDRQISGLYDNDWQITHNKGVSLWARGQHESGDVAHLELNDGTQVQAGLDVGQDSALTRLSVNYSNHTYNTHQNKINIDTRLLGANLAHKHQIGRAIIGVQGGFGAIEMDTTRTVTLANSNKTHRATADGRYIYAGVDAAYPIQFGRANITPYVGAYVNRHRTEALDEKDYSATAMVFDEQKYTTINGKLGIQTHYTINDKLAVNADLGYHKQLDQTSHAPSASLKTLSHRFGTPTPTTDEDTVSLGASIHYAINPSLNIGAHITHQNGDDDQLTHVGLSARLLLD